MLKFVCLLKWRDMSISGVFPFCLGFGFWILPLPPPPPPPPLRDGPVHIHGEGMLQNGKLMGAWEWVLHNGKSFLKPFVPPASYTPFVSQFERFRNPVPTTKLYGRFSSHIQKKMKNCSAPHPPPPLGYFVFHPL